MKSNIFISDTSCCYHNDNYDDRYYRNEYNDNCNYYDSKKDSKDSYNDAESNRGCKVDPSNPDTYPKFVDELPIPDVLQPVCAVNKVKHYEVEMKEVKQQLHSYFPETTVWGYNGVYPGPTIETYKDRQIAVKWINKLPKKHFLPVDKTLHGTIGTPEVRTVVHLHGANVDPDSDGNPEAWYSYDYIETGKDFKNKVYKYTNHQPAATLWYHDHALGITRLNVYAGLAGFYIIRDLLETELKLPSGEYDIPLLIQDKSFNKDGSLFYPDGPDEPIPGVYPSIVPAFFGNTILVNGKVWPYLKVKPRKYHFRLLNGSNTRTYTLKLSNNQSFYQIGSDGGLLSKPIELKTLTIAPAERADIIINFSQHDNENIILENNDTSPHTSKVMQFKVVLPLKGKDTSKLPEKLYPIDRMHEHLAKKTRDLALNAGADSYGRPMLTLNGMMWNDPATEKPELDTIEVWNLVNLAPFPHPIHLHLVQFQVVGRIPFDTDEYRRSGKIVYTGNLIEPDENEKGWKDTVRVSPGLVTRIIMHFKDFAGKFVWHCHILEHEDHDMMRPMIVMPVSKD